MGSSPRYSTHLYYGKDFVKLFKIFNLMIIKDPTFKKMKAFDEMRIFSLAVRTLIKDYVRQNFDRLVKLEREEKEKKEKLKDEKIEDLN